MDTDATWRDGLHDVGGSFALAEDAMPDFEVDEQPETIAVTRPARAVLVGQTPQRRAIEQPARLARGDRARTRRRRARTRSRSQRPTGTGKSHLLARQDRRRNQIAHRLARRPPWSASRAASARPAAPPRARRGGRRGTARGSRSTRPCSSGPASSAARADRSADRRGSCDRACRRRRCRSSASATAYGSRASTQSGRDRSRALERPRRTPQSSRGTDCECRARARGSVRLARTRPSARRQRVARCGAPALRSACGIAAQYGPAEPRVPHRHAIAVVAEEELVGAFAGQHDLDVVAARAARRSRAGRSTETRSARPRARPDAAARRRSPTATRRRRDVRRRSHLATSRA